MRHVPKSVVRETVALFEANHGCRVADLATKSNPSAPADDAIIDQVAERCDFMLTAIGD